MAGKPAIMKLLYNTEKQLYRKTTRQQLNGIARETMSQKVLLISQNFYPEIGSAGNRMKNIYLLLQDKGLDVDVLTTDPAYPLRTIYENPYFWDEPDLNQKAEKIKRVGVGNKKYSVSVWKRLLNYLEFTLRMVRYIQRSHKQYDVVFATSPPIFIGLAGLIARKRFKARFILDIRDLWPESLKGVGVFDYAPVIYVFRKLEKQLYQSADCIIINSEGFRAYVNAVSADFQEKLIYMPNGARQEEIKTIPPAGSTAFQVVYAGNIGRAQNDGLLFELARALAEKAIPLTIIGYGVKKQGLLEEIRKAGLGNVTVVEPKTRRDCLDIIAAHQAGIVTLTDSDVFKTVLPGKVIDYMTCGVPVVAAVSGFAKDIIQSEKAGLVSESQNAAEMLRHLEYLKANPAERARLGANGKKYVQQNFMWETNIEKLIKAIREEAPEKSLDKAGLR